MGSVVGFLVYVYANEGCIIWMVSGVGYILVIDL
jgi:hypothetical protein